MIYRKVSSPTLNCLLMTQVVQNLGVLKHFALWDILNSKSQTRKIVKMHKDFELSQVFIYNFPCQNVLIFPMYILFIKRIETFGLEMSF